ncbi:MAG: hypothetical protein OXI11_07060 [Gammaproteobacteria bacterium]|nr:hypothetical protein [Gammaproteobacteria bacterium]
MNMVLLPAGRNRSDRETTGLTGGSDPVSPVDGDIDTWWVWR